MVNVRDYLSRYLEGESTQEELRLLKEYFRLTADVPADLLPYSRMFALLEERQETPSVESLEALSLTLSPSPVGEGDNKRLPFKTIRIGIALFAAACIAAFAFMLKPSSNSADLQMGVDALTEIFSHSSDETEPLVMLFNEP